LSLSHYNRSTTENFEFDQDDVGDGGWGKFHEELMEYKLWDTDLGDKEHRLMNTDFATTDFTGLHGFLFRAIRVTAGTPLAIRGYEIIQFCEYALMSHCQNAVLIPKGVEGLISRPTL